MADINGIFESGGLFDGHYRLVRPLSTAGGSADVWLAIDVNTLDESGDESSATQVAIKVYRPKNLIDIEGEYQFRNEFRKVFSCHHENIIQPTYFSVYEEMPYLVLPYCPSGSSERLIGKLRTEEELWKYIYEVASGLAYLHEHSPRIIHQDIKPANVLVDDNGNYAITDFGISAEMGGTDIDADDESGGTFAYMAPERFVDDTPPMPESDIWAFGATVYEIITGDAPFGNDGGKIQTRESVIPRIDQPVPEPVKQLLYQCLAYDAKARPTARSIVETVLKKRYSHNRKTIAFIIGLVVMAAVGLTFYFTRQTAADTHGQLDSLAASGDSIVTAEIIRIRDNAGIPVLDNIAGLEKAKVLYTTVCRDADPDYTHKAAVTSRISAIDRLIQEIREYDRARDLADKARRTGLDEEYLEYSLLAEKHDMTINQLIHNLE